MNYTTEIVVDVPHATFIELFDDPDNMPKWQHELQSFEPVSGTPGQPGAKSRLRYRMGKRDLEIIETITVRNLPDEFSGTYETKGVWNSVVNRFYDAGPNGTRWVAETEFRIGGFLTLMAFFMPGMFKKQSLKFMEQFKAFAEREFQNAAR